MCNCPQAILSPSPGVRVERICAIYTSCDWTCNLKVVEENDRCCTTPTMRIVKEAYVLPGAASY